MRLDDLAIEPIRSVIAPFDAPDAGMSIAIEYPDGRVLVSAGAGARVGGGSEIRTNIAASGMVIGRVVATSTTESSLAGAVAAGVAASIGALADASLSLANETSVRVDVETESRRLAAELALACRIQRTFVPLIPPNVEGYELAGHYEAAREVGGDFFDIFPVQRRASRLAITIADVTGKGVAAALLMAFSRPLLHAAVDNVGTPVEALERTNQILVEEGRSTLFITALCAVLERRSGILRFANAGHEPPLFVPAGDAPVRWLEGSGPLLGVFPQLDLVECSIKMAPGDLVLLYTDGVTDMQAPDGRRFGDAALLDVVDSARGRAAGEVVDAIRDACRRFRDTMPAADDVTIVAIRRDPRTAARPTRRRPDASRS